MSGGAWEYVAGYVANGNESIIDYGGNLVKSGYEKYVNKYEAGSRDTREAHYAKAAPTTANKHYGDAVWETSNGYNTSDSSWYSDVSDFPYQFIPFFYRGGNFWEKTHAGVFSFECTNCAPSSDASFRVVVPVL